MLPPILRDKDISATSQFTPESLLRQARRQKGLPLSPVPEICILDPDGDIVRQPIATGRTRLHAAWACYHTVLHAFDHEENECGIVGCVGGGPFAVLVAGELFASGCRLLISVTSAGQILTLCEPPYFVVIDRALRDEGASHHYLPPADYSEADSRMIWITEEALGTAGIAAVTGAS